MCGGLRQSHFASHPDEILLAFDKPRCHAHLMRHDVMVAETITGITDYAQLVDRMRTLGWSRVFVKLATGSSALECLRSM